MYCPSCEVYIEDAEYLNEGELLECEGCDSIIMIVVEYEDEDDDEGYLVPRIYVGNW